MLSPASVTCQERPAPDKDKKTPASAGVHNRMMSVQGEAAESGSPTASVERGKNW